MFKQSRTTFILLTKSIKNKRFYANSHQQQQRLVPPNRYAYTAAFTFGLTSGFLAGYMLNLANAFSYNNEAVIVLAHPQPVPIHHGPVKRVRYPDSIYNNFPLKITLYQYETSPHSSQIRAYLDYFGFPYDVIEVDPHLKNEVVRPFNRQPHVPVCVFEDSDAFRRWFLYDTVSIISALETLRNENYGLFHKVFPKYMPMVTNAEFNYPNKYYVSTKSELNEPQWRKWINDTVVPALEWNSADTKKHAKETVKMFAEKCNWKERFFWPKRFYLKNVLTNELYEKRFDFRESIQGLDPNQFQKPIEIINFLVTTWMNSLNKDRSLPFNGIDEPNLADLSMYGAFRAFEGCEFYRENLNENEFKDFRIWFDKMHEYVSDHKGGRKSELVTVDWLTAVKQKLTEETTGMRDKAIKAVKDEASYLKNKARDAVNVVTGKANETKESLKKKGQEVVDKTNEEVEDVKLLAERGKKGISLVVDTINEAAGTVKDKASNYGNEVSEKMKEGYDETKDYVKEKVEKGKQKVGELKSDANEIVDMGKQKAGELKSDANQYVEKGKQKVGELKQNLTENVDSGLRKAEDLKDEVGKYISKGSKKVGQIGDDVKRNVENDRERIAELKSNVSQVIGENKQKASHYVDKAKKKIGELVEDEKGKKLKKDESGLKILTLSYVVLASFFAYVASHNK